MVSSHRQYRLVAPGLGSAVIANAFRQLKHRRRLRAARAELADRLDTPGAPHGLNAPLIVSLTSFPPRFPTLALTLRGILRQSVRPDRVILWLAEGDADALPDDVRDMDGLEVRCCPDWRSYKKIIPTIIAYPDAYIVTADDDVFYPRDWLAGLVSAVFQGARIACNRAHRVALDPVSGRPRPYRDWHRNIDAPEQSRLVFLTGVMGVIYAPGVFHREVTRDDLFMRLAPGTDDVWLYWMHRLAGVEARKIGERPRILEWEGTQAQSLRSQNLMGDGNDRSVQSLLDHYGWPI